MATLFSKIFKSSPVKGTPPPETTLPGMQAEPLPPGTKRAPGFRISKFQLTRERVDIKGWRESINEAESAYNPYRVKMQKMYQDTDLNEHLNACMNKRRNLTLLRKFKVCNAGGIEDEAATKLLKSVWFDQFQSFTIDALFYGYNLISLGSVVSDSLPELTFVRRANVSPDRLVVSNFPYMLSGASWYDPQFKDWYVYVKTPTETGVSPCGYGLLYRVAKTEILERNNTGYNADYNEMFGQPIRIGHTAKANDERDEFESGLRDMGSTAYMLLDNKDEESVELLEASNSGTTYNTYSDFEKRLEAKISKIILGHADALDSIPGKLGSQEEIVNALEEIQSRDAAFVLPVINNELFPRLRNLGFTLAEDLHFEYLNDDEAEDFRTREDTSNKATADIMKTISEAGGEPDWKYFSDRTGIQVEKKEVIPPAPIADPLKPPVPTNGVKH